MIILSMWGESVWVFFWENIKKILVLLRYNTFWIGFNFSFFFSLILYISHCHSKHLSFFDRTSCIIGIRNNHSYIKIFSLRFWFFCCQYRDWQFLFVRAVQTANIKFSWTGVFYIYFLLAFVYLSFLFTRQFIWHLEEIGHVLLWPPYYHLSRSDIFFYPNNYCFRWQSRLAQCWGKSSYNVCVMAKPKS